MECKRECTHPMMQFKTHWRSLIMLTQANITIALSTKMANFSGATVTVSGVSKLQT